MAERRDEPRGAVSPERFSYFWVAILRSGMVAAGCGPTPGVGQFLEWVDPAPLGSKLRHVALTSWDSEVLYRAIDVRSVSARELREASRGESLGGRFDGQPLMDALQPLLEQQALRPPPPKVVEKKRGGKRVLRVKRRRERGRMARYKNFL